MNFRIVESIGEDVHDVIEGDTVIPVFIPDCAECEDCKSPKSNLCSNFPFQVVPWMHRDQTSRFTDLKGETLYHFLFISSFSEYTVVDIAHITKVDPEIPPNRACLLSCGVSTGILMFLTSCCSAFFLFLLLFLLREVYSDWFISFGRQS